MRTERPTRFSECPAMKYAREAATGKIFVSRWVKVLYIDHFLWPLGSIPTAPTKSPVESVAFASREPQIRA